PRPPKTVVILGAGNVSAIPLTDAFAKLLQEGAVVLLKMSPVNDYLGPLFEQILRPFIECGYLRIAYGGPEAGATAINHPLTDEIHITGSVDSHDTIVWGPPGEERNRRIRECRPLLEKRVTSELGNVSPWIFVPGRYSSRQLQFQAENVAASVINNASHNCVATRVLITWKRWPLRTQLLDRITAIFADMPHRVAWYPGAVERFQRLTGGQPSDEANRRLPWTLLRDVNPDEHPQFFNKESFVCVLAEVTLDAPTAEEFLAKATRFANERLAGTLCAAITIPSTFRQERSREQLLQRCLSELKYGAIAVNHWPGIVYALMTPPWGGFPDSTLTNPQSGIGWGHNTFMLDGIEKIVLEGPLMIFPGPAWLPGHRSAEQVAWSFFRLYEKPSWSALMRVAHASLKG
ncbi:MAG: hypothetical protein KDA96_21005, partial [Planctomycetaceae bacterium]|nr:hypothetical protein [Planctomycetaceae bacterium]